MPQYKRLNKSFLGSVSRLLLLKTLQSTICAKANDGIDMIMMQMFSEHDLGCGVSIKETQNHAMFSLNSQYI